MVTGGSRGLTHASDEAEMTRTAAQGAHAGHGWIAAVAPASARRFRISDPRLAATVAAAGAELADGRPDVEVASVAELVGDAPLAVVSLGGRPRDGLSRFVQAGRRIAGSVRVRADALLAGRELRRRGYPSVGVLTWDLDQVLRVPGLAAPRPLRAAERFQQRAIVVGSRLDRAPTMLDAAVADAAETASIQLEPRLPAMGEALLLMVAEAGVIRVALGPARSQIDAQVAALEALQAAGPPPFVATRVPQQLAAGRSGLVEWSLERRLAGYRPLDRVSRAVLADCIDFLVALHGLDGAGTAEVFPSADAAAIAPFCGDAEAEAVRALGERLDSQLADVPRGFGHGDFWAGNLLIENGRLAGVVDWDAAGPGRVPLLDFLHLHLIAERRPGGIAWGQAIVEYLLPWAQAGGDSAAQEYCRRIGLDPSPALLAGLVAAYWLNRLAYQLTTYADRSERPVWVEHNLGLPLRALVVT
jgi:aminoglycoside phosphotransferase (APT) family kinase protein